MSVKICISPRDVDIQLGELGRASKKAEKKECIFHILKCRVGEFYHNPFFSSSKSFISEHFGSIGTSIYIEQKGEKSILLFLSAKGTEGWGGVRA